MSGGPRAVGGEQDPGDLVDEGVADQSRSQDGQRLAHPVDLLEGEEALGGGAGGQQHGGSGHGDGGDQGRGGGHQPPDVLLACATGTARRQLAGLEGGGQAGVEDGGHGDGQHRVGKDVDGLRVLIDRRSSGLPTPTGHGQDHQDAHLLGQDRPHPGPAEPQRPPGLGAPQSQGGAQTQPQPVDRPQQRQAEGGHPEGRPPAQHLEGEAGGGRVVAAGQHPVETIGRHDHEAGEHRCQRWPGEAVVSLEDAGEDDGHPVHGHLQGEHAQEGGDELMLKRRVHALGGGEQRGDRGGQDDEPQGQRGQDRQDQAQQPRGGGGDLLAPARGDRCGQERNDRGRQHAADDDLVEGVGQLVGRGVGTRHRSGADGGGLDEPAQEPQDAGDEGQAGDGPGH